MRYYYIVFLILGTVISCTVNPVGTYVAKDNHFFSDTLWVYDNNVFCQKITARNGTVVWDYKGEWKGDFPNVYFSGIVLDSDSLYHDENTELVGDEYIKALWKRYADGCKTPTDSILAINTAFFKNYLLEYADVSLERKNGKRRYVFRKFVDLPESIIQSWEETP